MAENFGIQGRGAFYEQIGTMRDVIQNHLFQVLANLAMEPPARNDSESMRDEKVKVLKSIAPIDPTDSCAASSAAIGRSPASRRIRRRRRSRRCGWRSIPGAGQGVPFYIRAGKSLPVTCTEVVVRLRRAPKMFPTARPMPNHMRFRIGPEIDARASA